jgi:hypothetical protein
LFLYKAQRIKTAEIKKEKQTKKFFFCFYSQKLLSSAAGRIALGEGEFFRAGAG